VSQSHSWTRNSTRGIAVFRKKIDTLLDFDGGVTIARDFTVPVKEILAGSTVWEGVVHIFNLTGNPSADRAYAWSYELSDGKRRFFSVLHIGPIDSPVAAVRAAIVAEHRAAK
jgi:hypothetical protein